MAVETSINRDAPLEERRRLQTLVDVNRELVSSLEMQRLLPLISECVTRVVPHDFAGVTLYEDDKSAMRAFVLSPPEARAVSEMGRTVALEQTLFARAFLEQKPQLLTRQDLGELATPIAGRMLDAGIQTVLCMPMVTANGAIGTLNVGSKRDRAFSQQDTDLLGQIAAQLAIALENARAYREIQTLRDRLSEQKLRLEDEIRSELNFEEIIGDSPELKRVLAQARTVAPSGSTALILGETGTGKELIARAIHRMSKRKDASFIKVNCAAIPTGLPAPPMRPLPLLSSWLPNRPQPRDCGELPGLQAQARRLLLQPVASGSEAFQRHQPPDDVSSGCDPVRGRAKSARRVSTVFGQGEAVYHFAGWEGSYLEDGGRGRGARAERGDCGNGL